MGSAGLLCSGTAAHKTHRIFRLWVVLGGRAQWETVRTPLCSEHEQAWKEHLYVWCPNSGY